MDLVLEAGLSVYENQPGQILQDCEDKDGVMLTKRCTDGTPITLCITIAKLSR